MTDQTQALSSIHTSSAAKERLAQRYRSERRFKLVGMGAVVVAALFLVMLLTSVVSQGYQAFLQHYVTLTVMLDEKVIDPSGTRDAAALSGANYATLVRDALVAEFPAANNRAGRRALAGLVSNGAGFALRDKVLANQSLIGTAVPVPLPLSDTADLFLKGNISERTVLESDGEILPSAVVGQIELKSSADDFARILTDLKKRLDEAASGLQQQMPAIERRIERIAADLAAKENELAGLSDEAAKTVLSARTEVTRSDLAAAQAELNAAKMQIEELRARAAAQDGREKLTAAMPSYFIQVNGGVVKLNEVSNNLARGEVLLPLNSAEAAAKKTWTIAVEITPQAARKISDQEIVWLRELQARNRIENRFNAIFFTSGASREAELAGIWGAVVGSFYTMLVTLLLSFPVGVAAAVYLEEFAPRNRWTDLIEVNINNLAAVPSIVFGLLGLAVFLNVFGMPRSAPIAGGMVLALMTLSTIIIASRAALKAVPPSIREGALGIGASHIQTVFHHVVPLALPGMLTGTIIGMAQALGETAPLLMIGMVAFIVDIPGGPLDPATVLPVQIYMWADFPEPAFRQKTAAAIIVLLGFLILMNAVAVLLRKQFERRW